MWELGATHGIAYGGPSVPRNSETLQRFAARYIRRSLRRVTCCFTFERNGPTCVSSLSVSSSMRSATPYQSQMRFKDFAFLTHETYLVSSTARKIQRGMRC